MNAISQILYLLIFISSFWFCTSANGGVFSNSLSTGKHATDNNSLATSSAIFKKHLGVSNPVQWAKQLHGTANINSFLDTSAWRNASNEIFKIYGRDVQVQNYVEYQEYLFRKAIKINNKASFKSLDIKGNLAESLMDDFFIKDGWEIINGKRGRNGFDGLYVKRSSKGAIIDWIAADAKSGNAKLTMTNRGKQLSSEWVNGNLKDLLAMAEDDLHKNPTVANQQRVSDIKQIMRLQGRSPRVFTMKIEQSNGKIFYKLESLSIDGQVIGKPMLVDMQTGYTGGMQQLIYKNLENQIASHDPKHAVKIVGKIKRGFERGTIRNDSDLYRLIKSEIPDKNLARAVVEELGDEPPRGSLAGKRGQQIARNPGMLINAMVIAGFIIAHDAMYNQLSRETFLKAGVASIATITTAVALDYGMNIAIKQTSTNWARYSLAKAGKQVTEKATVNFAKQLTPTIGRAAGGILQVAFAGVFIGKTIYDYNSGSINQTDMFVHVGIIALTTAGTVFFTCTSGGAKAGAVVGTFFGPGAGTAAGAIIGAAIGVLGGVASGGYTWYTESKRQDALLQEARFRAEWERENNKENIEKLIQKLQSDSNRNITEAWKILTPNL